MVDKKCADIVAEKWASTKADIKAMRDYENKHNGDCDPELGCFNEYGLSLDYVEPGTFNDQREGYLRYQMSYGGPSDEIRFYENGDIEYWYLNWFDGACVDITNDDIAIELRDEFSEYGIEGWRYSAQLPELQPIY